MVGIINIQKKESCCGCTACASICPESCITMSPDQEGFLYPKVDESLCVQCGQCEKICPSLSGFVSHPIQAAYAVRHKADVVLTESTSGGAFTAFAEEVLAQGGVVFGVGFTDNFKIAHMEAQDNSTELSTFRGSKYIQSFLGNTFSRVQKHLLADRSVLFSGTPCQIYGLRNYLGRDWPNLLTVEVICHGTPSPILWDEYLEHQINRYRARPKSISFRKKTYGYHSGTMEIVFDNGRKYTGSARVDYMLKSFFSEISSRPACYSCICKGMERPADLSIFDCWNAGSLVPGLQDDDRGYTNVLVNTAAGANAFDRARLRLEYHPVNAERAIALDGVMVCNYPKKHPDRKKYYNSLCENGLEKTISELIPVTKTDYLIEKSKVLFHRLGLMRILRKLKKR